jgi:hypothetical protein
LEETKIHSGVALLTLEKGDNLYAIPEKTLEK